MKTKTVLIWNDTEQLRYAIVEGDLRKFQGVYINSTVDIDKQNELSELVFNPNGDYSIPFCSIVEAQVAVAHGAYLVEAGFIM